METHNVELNPVPSGERNFLLKMEDIHPMYISLV